MEGLNLPIKLQEDLDNEYYIWTEDEHRCIAKVYCHDAEMGHVVPQRFPNAQNAKAYAELIVRAVNNHDELLAALKDAVDSMNSAYEQAPKITLLGVLSAGIKRAESAIQKAKS